MELSEDIRKSTLDRNFLYFAGLLEYALVRDATSELQLSALEALLEVAGAEPSAFAAYYSHRMPWLRNFLNHHDAAGDFPTEKASL